MKIKRTIILLSSLLIAGAAIAQDEPQTEQEPRSSSIEERVQDFGIDEDPTRTLDKIVITGNAVANSWNKGLWAFQRGEYKLAELEFRSVNNAIRSVSLDVAGRVNLFGSDTGVGVGNGVNPLFLGQIGLVTATESRRVRRRGPRTRGASFQTNFEQEVSIASYAVGAALLKQEKYDEARRFFSSAVGNDKDNHDARMRLGLIALLQDDQKEARRRLRQLKNYCAALDCNGDNVLSVSVQTLERAIADVDALEDIPVRGLENQSVVPPEDEVS